jgi:hypothetical protein
MPYVNESRLKALYPHGETDESNRSTLRITMTPNTLSMLKGVVPFGKGLYGSAFIELSVRVLTVCMAYSEDVENIAAELKSVDESGILTINLRRLLKYLES